MEKSTIVDRIEIERDGTVSVRFRKLIVDGEQVYDLGMHRMRVEPGADLDALLTANNAHLASMGMGEVATDDMPQVRSVLSLIQTPEKTQLFMAMKQAREEADRAAVAAAEAAARAQG